MLKVFDYQAHVKDDAKAWSGMEAVGQDLPYRRAVPIVSRPI